MNDKIISKIQKLLALSESDNMHEAELAMTRAMDLMTKHNISMSEAMVDLTPAQIGSATVVIGGRTATWVLQLVAVAGKLFDCKVLGQNRGRTYGNRGTLYGTPENIAAAQALITHLIKCWKGMSAADYKNMTTADSQLRFLNSHGVGFVRSIHGRVAQMLADRERELRGGHQATALALVKMSTLIEQHIKEHVGSTSKGRGGQSSSTAGHTAGCAAGASVGFGGSLQSRSVAALT